MHLARWLCPKPVTTWPALIRSRLFFSFFHLPLFSSVFVNSTVYVVDYEGKCTSKADPAGNPPNAIPFSMLIIDSGARGNAVKIGAWGRA